MTTARDPAPCRPQAGVREGFVICLGEGETLHLWQKPIDKASQSRVEVQAAGGATSALIGAPSDDFVMTTYVAAVEGEVGLAWDEADTLVSLCYAFDPAHVLEKGIRVLWTREETRANAKRYRLHLAPPFGWMNDPNGLIEIGGLTHVFYQHYPHARHWDTMHWGHAVSANLVDWAQLPVFLHPHPTMLADPTKAGGAYSGSAIARAEGGLRIFHTDREDERQPEQEWQMTAVASDMINAGPSTAVIDRRPPLPGFGLDFRDPYVFKGPDGLWKMVLGGADQTAALVLLYETDAPDAATGWRFAGVLHRERLDRAVPAECPCVVALDGEGADLFALVFGLIGHRDPVTNRKNPSFVLVGRFDGVRFEEIARRDLDFIGDCYAFQSFVHRSRPVGIAWAANWADVRRLQDFPSSMTFPRRLVWKEGWLHMPPVESVFELRGRLVASEAEALMRGVALPDGLAEIAFTVARRGAPFRLELSLAGGSLALTYDGADLEFTVAPAPARARMSSSKVKGVTLSDVRLFVDVGLIEIFADGGRWCGVKRVDSDEPITAARLVTEPGVLMTAEVWALRPRWGA